MRSIFLFQIHSSHLQIKEFANALCPCLLQLAFASLPRIHLILHRFLLCSIQQFAILGPIAYRSLQHLSLVYQYCDTIQYSDPKEPYSSVHVVHPDLIVYLDYLIDLHLLLISLLVEAIKLLLIFGFLLNMFDPFAFKLW